MSMSVPAGWMPIVKRSADSPKPYSSGRQCDLGSRSNWVAGAGVHHRLPAERLTPAFVRRWAIGAGHSRVIMGRAPNLAHRLPGRLTVHQVRRALRDLLLGGLGAAFTIGDRRIRSHMQWWSGQGQLAELWRLVSRKGDG